jgi:nicotinate-nucleotide adenylyltransferase
MHKDTVMVVFGGAFNPPTLAHYQIYQAAKKVLYFDRFIYLPVSQKYPKQALVADHHRFEMLKLMTEGDDDIIIEPYEFDRPAFEGTVHTLHALKEKYRATIVFALGTDQMKTMATWIEAKTLLEEFQFLVFERQESLQDVFKKTPFLKPYQPKFKGVQIDLPIASQVYRDTKDDTFLDPRVSAYIHTHHLYEETS